jgi:hypothetical protein
VASELELGEDPFTVDGDLERATRRLDQPHVRLGECFADLGRRPDGPGLIVSDDAVLDGDAHARVSSMEAGTGRREAEIDGAVPPPMLQFRISNFRAAV